MNPQIEKQVSELLELVKNGAESLPPYLQTLAHQVVISELMSSGFFFASSLVTLAASAYYARKFWAKHREDKYDCDLPELPACLLTVFAVIALTVGMLSFSEILNCLFAPDLVAFKALRGLVK